MYQVLVVDDEPLMSGLVAEALAARGGDVVPAYSSASALDVLAASNGAFDAVIVVCMLARGHREFTGVEVVQDIFQRWPWLPVVVVRGVEERHRLSAELLLTGTRAFLEWPFGAADLRVSVEAIVRRHRRRLRASPDVLATIKRMPALVRDRGGEIPALEEVAGMAGVSRSYFSRMFHSTVGKPFRDYVRDLRLTHAYELLVTSRLSLTAIALEAGFYDLPHFDKAFRQRLGLSPRQFRRCYSRLPRSHGRGSPAPLGRGSPAPPGRGSPVPRQGPHS
jgi:AraC-like DNA-binding protein